jgi:N-acetylmuramoyl-L-alanine amidase
LPVRTYDRVPAAYQTLRWQEPKGTTGPAPTVEALELQSRHPSTTINLLVVSAAAYPPGYWQSFASSTTWQKFTEAGKTVVVDAGRSGSSTTAMGEDRGYVIQLTTKGVSEKDVLRVMQGIRWR